VSDVFISYARSTAAHAQALAKALRALGYSIWLDDELPAHRAYSGVIEEQLTAAKAVLVVWSADAVRSEWVLSEANRAREDHKLVQLAVDKTRLPMPFDQTQCADLTGWRGDTNAPGWRKVVASIADLTGAISAPSPQVPARPHRSIWAGRSAWLLGGVVVIAILLVALWLGLRQFRPSAPPSEARVAIMPFESRGEGLGPRDFAAGLTDEILSVLSADQIQAISRSDSLALRGANRREALDRLGVGLLLDGAVQGDGNSLRVTVHLDDAREHVTLWSKDFEGASSGPDALQAEVAARAADMTKWAIVGRSAGGEKIDTATLAAFIQGSEQLSNGGGRAIPILRQVVARAPGFAAGHSHLAVALAGSVAEAPPGDRTRMVAETQTEARRALTLDPKSGEAYLALQVVSPLGAWQEREALMLRGLSVDPDFPYLNSQYSVFLAQVGRNAEALAVAERAEALNPLFVFASANKAKRLMAVGQIEQARSTIDRAARLWPESPITTLGRFYATALTGSATEARALLDDPKTRPITATSVDVGVWAAVLKVRDSKNSTQTKGAARTVVAAAEAGQFDRRDAVLALALLGDVDDALLQVERFYGPERLKDPLGRDSSLDMAILFHPATRMMRRDPRFIVLAAKVGLVDYWRKSGKWPDFCHEPGLPYDCRAEGPRLSPKGEKAPHAAASRQLTYPSTDVR
jgi:TolB-like protein/Tfp pilus assembly protein PilF